MSRVLARRSQVVAQPQWSCYARHYSAPADGSIPDAKKRFVPDSGSFPKGFVVGSSHAGVKPSNKSRDDITLITSERPCTAIGMFTRNVFQAAPVQVSKAILNRNKSGLRGVVINSGCANAVTGDQGIKDAIAMSKAAADLYTPFPNAGERELSGIDALGVEDSTTLVMSTGVIGQKLPMDRILPALPKAKDDSGSDYSHWLGVAKAIMTTDTFPKLVTKTFSVPSHPDTTYTIAGISKGAGMIHPNMGTLLSVICTDYSAPLSDHFAIHVKRGTNASFNSITIDGDTSTNDTVLVLANGAAAPPERKPGMVNDDLAFREALGAVMLDLAKLVVRDGEGATKFIAVRTEGRLLRTSLAAISRSICKSPLVKTAMYGKDGNWGRILCAIGYSGVKMAPETVSVALTRPNVESGGEHRLEMVRAGQPLDFGDADVKPYLDEEDVTIVVNIDLPESAHPHSSRTYYTCDFSHEYVTINADYRT